MPARSLAASPIWSACHPTLCLLLGQGGGGAALALLPADRVICAQHGWLSPLPPEAASAFLYRTTERAPEIAAEQRVRSLDLMRAGIADWIVAERPDAADEPAPFLARAAQIIQHTLAELLRTAADDPQDARYQRYRRVGLPPNGPPEIAPDTARNSAPFRQPLP